MTLTTQYPTIGLTLTQDDCGTLAITLTDNEQLFVPRVQDALEALDFDAVNTICDIEDDLTEGGVFGGSEENDCIDALSDQIFFTHRHTPLLPPIDYSDDDLADIALLQAYGY